MLRSGGWSPHEWDFYSYKRDPIGLPSPSGKWRLQKASSLQPKRGPSPEPNNTGILILDFQPSEAWEIHFSCLLNLTVCGIFLQHPRGTKTPTRHTADQNKHQIYNAGYVQGKCPSLRKRAEPGDFSFSRIWTKKQGEIGAIGNGWWKWKDSWGRAETVRGHADTGIMRYQTKG